MTVLKSTLPTPSPRLQSLLHSCLWSPMLQGKVTSSNPSIHRIVIDPVMTPTPTPNLVITQRIRSTLETKLVRRLWTPQRLTHCSSRTNLPHSPIPHLRVALNNRRPTYRNLSSNHRNRAFFDLFGLNLFHFPILVLHLFSLLIERNFVDDHFLILYKRLLFHPLYAVNTRSDKNLFLSMKVG
ncbi:hypothetical protein F5890DRAFT_1094048 [Lentinula detonsa]|uniref:Uncharacterized protein n=1 Tax=Lentinula detonsa TaxID=2804962 RepID=A0AA38Q267_9AGAR|nr:hypothetical protein F5890DRAFT_1094048 [Lentinula detonsa]